MEQVSAKVSDELENQIIAEQKLGKTVSYISVDLEWGLCPLQMP
jgi:Cu2+-exporting ATPase